MKTDFEQPPFSSLPVHLREWFESVVEQPDLAPISRLWHLPLPTGSTSADAIVVSRCLWTLFPEQAAAALFTPVDVEFKL
jgi:hypothetical protein